MSLAIAFNNQLNKFVEELVQTYPEDQDFPYYGRLIAQLMRVNVKKPGELFAYYVRNHIDEIYGRNSDFFLKNSDHLIMDGTDDKENQVEAFRLIDNLRNYWARMSDQNQNVIWDYLVVLTKLSLQLLNSSVSK